MCEKMGCKFRHPELSDLPALKESIVAYMIAKKLPDNLKNDVCNQIDVVSGKDKRLVQM
jgi:hypothetical protein